MKANRRQKVIKIRLSSNEIKNRKTTEKTNKHKSWLFLKINKIDKPVDRLNKKEETEDKNYQHFDKKGDITAYHIVKGVLRE